MLTPTRLAFALAVVISLAVGVVVGRANAPEERKLTVRLGNAELSRQVARTVVPFPDTSVALPRMTLRVHSDGCGVIRSGTVGGPHGLQWTVTDQDGFTVLGRNALGETHYRYFRPGTYTVVLEAWGGSYYVPVSNRVTIRC